MWESMELGTAVIQTPTPGTMQECYVDDLVFGEGPESP